jgi:hypothetical protein
MRSRDWAKLAIAHVINENQRLFPDPDPRYPTAGKMEASIY